MKEAGQQDDELVRCVLYPKGFEKGVFSAEKLFEFGKEETYDKGYYSVCYAMSIALRKFLIKEEDVRALGCRTAKFMNVRSRERSNKEPEPIKEATHYVGYYQSSKDKILEIKGEFHNISVIQKVENYEEAHGHVEVLQIKGTSKQQAKPERTKIFAKIRGTFSGPTRQICEEDAGVKAQLDQLYLPQLPSRDPERPL